MVPTPWIARREFLDRMDHELNLSREQYDRIASIMKQSQERTRKRVGPEIQEELRQVRREIRAELTPDQAKRFEEFQREVRRPQRPLNEGPDMRRGPPPMRRDQPPPQNPRPETDTP